MQGQMGSSSAAYPGLESRISNARTSCFVLVFVFVRLDSVCSHARSVVTVWSRDVFPAVDTSSWFHQRALSLSAHRHFWSLNPYSSPSRHHSVDFNKFGRKLAVTPAAAACGCAGLLLGSCGCTGSASPAGRVSVSASAACRVSHPHWRLEFAWPGMRPDPLFLD